MGDLEIINLFVVDKVIVVKLFKENGRSINKFSVKFNLIRIM